MLNITTPENLTSFDPGTELEVICGWEFDEAPSSLELRLVWSTTGRGDRDLKVVSSTIINDVDHRGEKTVLITLPWGPYSFSGKLISLIWGLELVAFPSKDSTRTEITIAPRGEEVLLHKSKA